MAVLLILLVKKLEKIVTKNLEITNDLDVEMAVQSLYTVTDVLDLYILPYAVDIATRVMSAFSFFHETVLQHVINQS